LGKPGRIHPPDSPKRHHWGREFYIANALAKKMPGGGWTRHILAAARKYLLEQGRIVEARPRTHNTQLSLDGLNHEGVWISYTNNKKHALSGW
jgi:hypothetical protein